FTAASVGELVGAAAGAEAGAEAGVCASAPVLASRPASHASDEGRAKERVRMKVSLMSALAQRGDLGQCREAAVDVVGGVVEVRRHAHADAARRHADAALA